MSIATWTEQLKSSLHTWAYLGHREQDGHVVIGTGTHDDARHYLHTYFAGLSDEAIRNLETKYALELPQDLKDFYRFSNGVSMFNNDIAIYGLECSNAPYDDAIHTLDKHNDKLDALGIRDKSQLIIGHKVHIGTELTYLYLDTTTNVIQHATHNEDLRPRDTWKHLSSFLLGEYKRLAALHNKQGERVFYYPLEQDTAEVESDLDEDIQAYLLAPHEVSYFWHRIDGKNYPELIETFESHADTEKYTIRIADIDRNTRSLVTSPQFVGNFAVRWPNIVVKADRKLKRRK